MTKKQVTFTLEPEYIKYLELMAKHEYEGNVSMAVRKIISYHSTEVNYQPPKGKS